MKVWKILCAMIALTMALLFSSACLADEVSEGDACTHTDKIFETITEPTCTEDGSGEWTCQNCNSSQRYIIPALGHEWERRQLTSPTCIESGVAQQACIHCGLIGQTTVVPALGHNWVDGPETPAACTEDGSIRHVCAVCGALGQSIVIPAFGHRWEAGPEVPATCTESGKTQQICAFCGEAQTTAILPALGHIWGEEIQTQPTCTDAGGTTRACETCGQTEQLAAVPATGHFWDAGWSLPATCTEAGLAEYVCAACSAIQNRTIPPLGHEMGGWVVIQQPTDSEPGVAQRCCIREDVCEERSIPIPTGGLPDIRVYKQLLNASQNGTFFAEGEPIHYLVCVYNAGSTEVQDLVVWDSQAPEALGAMECLNPGESGFFPFTHTVTDADVNAGCVEGVSFAFCEQNTFSSNGVSVSTGEGAVTIPQAAVSVSNLLAPDLLGGKDIPFAAGQPLKFYITVTNTGSETLENVTIQSSRNADFRPEPLTLEPGQFVTVTLWDSVTPQDCQNGSVVHTAAVCYDDPEGRTHTAVSLPQKLPAGTQEPS